MPATLAYKRVLDSLSRLRADTLVRVVYVSMLTVKSRLNPVIFDDLAIKATISNKANGITGILSYGKGAFLQCVEGKKSDVLMLLKSIFNDSRHKDIKVLMCKPIEARYFNDWRMRMLFCESWLWSANTKEQANHMFEFLPFEPHHWSTQKLNRFIEAVKSFEATVQRKNISMIYNTFGQMVQRVIGPHQAFLLVQGVLGIMVLISLIELYFFL